MLPPIPQGLVPVTVQQDVVKQQPNVPTVTPTQDSAQSSDVSLQDKDSEQVRERLRDEQRRQQEKERQRQQAAAGQQEEEHSDKDGEQEKSGMSRRGLWVDVRV